MSKRKKEATALKAYAKLQMAAEKFQKAIEDFGKAYDTKFVGINEWSESISDMMFELDQDITETFEESLFP